MTTITGAPVVVGIDSSAGALAAVRVAAREARLRHRGLRIVHAFTWPPTRWNAPPRWAAVAPDACRAQTRFVLAQAARTARRVAPGVDLTGVIAEGQPAPVLLAESEHAMLVVVGSRAGGGLPGMLIGSVAGLDLADARSPVLVVRGRPNPDGPVIVGVNGSRTSTAAVDFAAEEATLRNTDLVAVHAWSDDDTTELTGPVRDTSELEERVLAEASAGLTARFPDLRVRPQVRRGSARHLLRDWSQTAQLIVVGTRRPGGFAERLPGSVSHYLLRRAACPTVVVGAAKPE
ncbi:universal stress protein [Paractinoplanes rishiriensis]|uniref:Universal stress protein n=1 Tax=Paractinoplanes rishiriensis TaxID=1050105 RepID=A0A919MW41_9ACTN|nr:universal stress protein [Actinoplanes rishiriensis]GIF02082.1 universal stress protein [Actinoplanes rishiriensis]